MPLGSISISFLNCNFPLHKGQSKVMNLLVNFLSSSNVTVVGSSSDNSKSSGTGFFLNFHPHGVALRMTPRQRRGRALRPPFIVTVSSWFHMNILRLVLHLIIL